MFKEMLSESSASSCMRFCVVLIVITTLFNWTLGTVGVILGWVESAGVDVTEIVALLGALGIKGWQKKTEKEK